jgi:serine/threonine-protein kinase
VTSGDTDARADPMIGKRIDRFVVQSKLAEGGMGAVYLATHERFEHLKKVIKVLLGEYSRHEVIRQRFEREAEAASRLKHPHIIQIDSFGTLADGQLFLMMPFLDGKPLDKYLQQHRTFTEHRALHIMVQVASALQHMHDAGMVHRDLKPGNIFITETKTNPYFVTLIDLGIAKVDGDKQGPVTHTGMAIGTPAYMAVEQFENAGAVSPLADMYSAAIVTWELLTGELPWGYHNAPVLYRLQMSQPPTKPTGGNMSAAYEAILRSALAVRVEDRPPSLRALMAALASATPAIPPHVPSGAEILADLAPEFVQKVAPSDETIRDVSNSGARVAPLLWPQRETSVDSPPPSRPAQQMASASAPVLTVNERPDAGQIAAAVSYPSLPTPSSRPERGERVRRSGARIALLFGGVMAVSAVAAYLLARSGSDPTPQHAALDASSARVSVLADASPQPTKVTSTPSDASVDVAPDASPTTIAVELAPTPAIDAGASAETSSPRPAPTPIVPRGTGELEVLVQPWAAITVNGRSLGQTPVHEKLPVGRYRVRIANDVAGKDETVTVTVTAGKTTTIRRNW